jgi:hypothetical protein
MTVPDALRFFGERKQDFKVDQIKKLSEAAPTKDSDDSVRERPTSAPTSTTASSISAAART